MMNQLRLPIAFVLPGLLILALMTACDGGPSEPESRVASVASLSIAPDSAVLDLAQTQAFTATALDGSGEKVAGVAIEWSGSDDAVATVDGKGVVTAAASGTVEITATAEDVSASVSVRVREPVAAVVIAPDSAVLFIGESRTLTARAFDASGAELTGRTMAWASSDEAVVSISDSGVATGRGVGSVTITATVQGAAGEVPARSRDNPVKATSYENFKEMGYQPVDIPLGESSDWFGMTEEAHAFGDFFGQGAGTQAMFTVSVVYSVLDHDEESAPHSVYRFWRHENGAYVEDNTILTAAITPCLHPRKALVADFNLDGRPDVFLACTGYDGRSYPGETNQVILSEDGGGYLLQEASPDIGFWHGAAAADLNGDAYPDVVAVEANDRAVFLNNGDGSFNKETVNRLPGNTEHQFGGRIYFNVVLADVDEDGDVDLFLGGHEWSGAGGTGESGDQQTLTQIFLNAGDNDFSAADSVVIPEVLDEGVVNDFAVTGTGATRTVWILRTGGNAEAHDGEGGRYYDSATLQRYDWASGTASVVYSEHPAGWPAWIMPYTRNGALYVGSSDLRRPLEYAVP